MPIRFMTPIPLPPQEFVEPNATDAFIWWLFKHRCVVCRKEATEINEIEPRSRSKKNLHDWRNRVCVCRECHNEYHKHGVNDEAIAKMKGQRKNFLLEMGREEYVNYYPDNGLSKIVEPLLETAINEILPDGLEFRFDG